MTGLAPGSHLFTARALYGGGLESSSWGVIVASALTIDTSTMVLSGLSVKANGYPTGRDSIGNTAVRIPQGGTPPYFYQSVHPTIATVDNAGKVVGMDNGSAVIRVTDSQSASVSYPVTISNIYTLLWYYKGGQDATNQIMRDYVLRNGGSFLTPEAVADLNRTITISHRSVYYWTGTFTGAAGLAIPPGTSLALLPMDASTPLADGFFMRYGNLHGTTASPSYTNADEQEGDTTAN